jgi:hypothetical protein
LLARIPLTFSITSLLGKILCSKLPIVQSLIFEIAPSKADRSASFIFSARFLDPRGVVCGLRFKFDTTRDAAPRAEQIRAGIASGFVVAA